MIVEKLRTLDRYCESTTPALLWVGGVVLLADAIFQWGAFTELASYPREFVFINGLLLWASAGLSRRYQKRAKRLKQEVKRKEEHIEYLETDFDSKPEGEN